MATVLMIGDAPEYLATLRKHEPNSWYVTVLPGDEPALDEIDEADTILVLSPEAFGPDGQITVDTDWLWATQELVLHALVERVAADAKRRKVKLSAFRLEKMARDAWKLSGNSAVVEAHLYAQLAKRAR